MDSTHAEVAKQLINQLPPGVFGRAALDAVMDHNFALLESMLPGMEFRVSHVARDEWQLAGTGTDGSTCIWRVGG